MHESGEASTPFGKSVMLITSELLRRWLIIRRPGTVGVGRLWAEVTPRDPQISILIPFDPPPTLLTKDYVTVPVYTVAPRERYCSPCRRATEARGETFG